MNTRRRQPVDWSFIAKWFFLSEQELFSRNRLDLSFTFSADEHRTHYNLLFYFKKSTCNFSQQSIMNTTLGRGKQPSVPIYSTACCAHTHVAFVNNSPYKRKSQNGPCFDFILCAFLSLMILVRVYCEFNLSYI